MHYNSLYNKEKLSNLWMTAEPSTLTLCSIVIILELKLLPTIRYEELTPNLTVTPDYSRQRAIQLNCMLLQVKTINEIKLINNRIAMSITVKKVRVASYKN